MIHQRSAIEQFPPEFRPMLEQYWKELMNRGGER